jgi:hypothetical protein
MKRFALMALACLLPLSLGSAAGAGFTVASVKGPYLFDATGTLVYSGDRYDVNGAGLVIFDGKGNLSGQEMYAGTDSGGTAFVCSLSLAGTYQVNSDGTGSAVTNFTATSGICPNTTVNFFGVGNRGETDIEAVVTGATDAAANGGTNNINALVLHTRFIKQQ